METVFKKPAFLIGTALFGGATWMAIRNKKKEIIESSIPYSPPPPITSASTAIQNAPYVQCHHELSAILEDMGRFYRIDPQIYTDIVFFCNTVCKIMADVQDHSIPLQLGDFGKAMKAKTNAIAAIYFLREKCGENTSMLHVITQQLRDLDSKLSDICHNIHQVQRGRLLEVQL